MILGIDMNDEEHKKTQISLGYMAIALLLIFGLRFLFARNMSREIPYSEFKQYLEQGMVGELVVSQTDIRGVIVRSETEQEPFVTNRVEDPDLVQKLEEKGVRFSGRPANSLFSTLLSWIFPLLIIFAIWNFTMRKMSIGGPGILNVGQSKARLVFNKHLCC